MDQQAVDQIYDSFVNLHMEEIAKFMKELDRTPKARKFVKHSCKPYWSDLLTEKWKNVMKLNVHMRRRTNSNMGILL